MYFSVRILSWMLKPYNKKRHAIFQLLENLNVLSSNNDKSIEVGLKFITHYRHSHKEWIDLDKNHVIQPDLTMLSDGWFKAVTGLKREQGQVIKKINRHFYEMAVFMVMTTDLNCGDAYVPDAFIYDDPNKQPRRMPPTQNQVTSRFIPTKSHPLVSTSLSRYRRLISDSLSFVFPVHTSPRSLPRLLSNAHDHRS